MHRTSSLVRIALAAALAIAPVVARATPAPVDVAIVTTMGTIVVELDRAHAPLTAGNFLKHVDARTYDHGASFYRTVHTTDPAHPAGLEIIQGGIEPAADKLPPIAVEKTTATGLHNVAGTIAMARTADPASATSEFYINTGDDRVLDADQFSDGFGYAVFGRIVRGMDVVKKIQTSAASGQSLTPPIKILRVERVHRT
jgi:peptidyl-prolyl cis-trans isomerase A (cyclophilin A)